MAAYDFPDTAGQPSDGSFTYTAPDGTLYEWNGYAWQVPDSGNPGGGGGGNFEIPTQALPPAGASDGDMFWCTDDGRLYIYYEDADTSQWVDASPDNTSEAVDSYWAKSGSTLSPIDTADSVDIGSGNITLNADGSITAANRSEFGIDTHAKHAIVANNNTGSQSTIVALQYDADGVCFSGRDATASPSDDTSRIYADGSAEFAGEVLVGADGAGLPKVRVNPNGYVNIQGVSTNSECLSIYDNSASLKTSLLADGSGTFEGLVRSKDNIRATKRLYSDSQVGDSSRDWANSAGTYGLKRDQLVLYNSQGTTNGTTAIGFSSVSALGNSKSAYITTVASNLGNNSVNLDLDFYTHQNSSTQNRVLKLSANGTAQFYGTLTAPGLFFNLEADDDTKYTTTTDADGNETLVYNGAVLDVKERILNVISRMDAIEANEVTDDATDSALLTLVASLSSRLDERDATIAALTTRITTLEIQSNGGN